MERAQVGYPHGTALTHKPHYLYESMKRALLPILLLTSGILHAQCPGCAIDFQYTAPGIYPDSLPDATQGTYYSTDVTFVMPIDTTVGSLTLDFVNFEIRSITGLPAGVSWECDESANGCNYNPQQNEYGCVKLCGTPILSGLYNITVEAIPTLTIVGTQGAVYFQKQLLVLPGSASNDGFSMTPAAGCAPVTVNFSNLKPGLTSYLWEFGDSLQSTSENPPPHLYQDTGTYVVNQTVTVDTFGYLLKQIEVIALSGCDDWPFSAPDLFLHLPQLGIVTSTVDNTNPPVAFNFNDVPLNNTTYKVDVWEEDGFIPFDDDDSCGAVFFQGHTAGVQTVNNGSGLVLEVTIEHPVLVLTYTDTVHVFASPPVPSVLSGHATDSICTGDTIWLSTSGDYSFQWFKDGAAIAGETDSTLVVTASGDYTVEITNQNGCRSTSQARTVTVMPNPPTPGITFDNWQHLSTSLTGFALQWYKNDLPVPGETSPSLTITEFATYFVEAISPFGCISRSSQLNVGPTGLNGLQASPIVIVPNPSFGTVHFMGLPEGEFSMNVVDMRGRAVVQKVAVRQTVDLRNLESGCYYVHLRSSNGQHFRNRLVLIR